MLYLGKPPDLIKRYVTLFAQQPTNKILDLGIFLGGSAAFLALTAKPDKLLALELSTDRVEILDRFIEKEGLGDSLHAEYGVDQANKSLVRKLADEHLGPGRCIDLVVDDASHMLAPTRNSFEAVFPRIRAGGSYIVEDFANSYIASTIMLKRAQEGDGSAEKMIGSVLKYGLQADHKPLHLLAVEAMLASINNQGLIQRVVVDRHWLRIIRGRKDFEDENSFDLRAMADDQFSLLDSTPSSAISAYLDESQ